MTDPAPVYKTYRTNGTHADADLTPPDDAEHWESVRRLAISLLRIADRELGRKQTIPERKR